MQHTLAQWRLVFWITLGVLLGTNVVFVAFASGDEQWWNDPQRVKGTTKALEEGKGKSKMEEPRKSGC